MTNSQTPAELKNCKLENSSFLFGPLAQYLGIDKRQVLSPCVTYTSLFVGFMRQATGFEPFCHVYQLICWVYEILFCFCSILPATIMKTLTHTARNAPSWINCDRYWSNIAVTFICIICLPSPVDSVAVTFVFTLSAYLHLQTVLQLPLSLPHLLIFTFWQCHSYLCLPDWFTFTCRQIICLQSAVQVTVDFMGCSLLKKYYSQLQLLHSRFPMASGEAIEVVFKWYQTLLCLALWKYSCPIVACWMKNSFGVNLLTTLLFGSSTLENLLCRTYGSHRFPPPKPMIHIVYYPLLFQQHL